MTPISLFYVLWLFIKYGDLQKVVECLRSQPLKEKEIEGEKDFVVSLFGWNLFFLSSRQEIQRHLSANAEAKLTYVQKNLNLYLGHTSSINCYDFPSEEWKEQHTTIRTALKNQRERCRTIFLKNRFLLFNEYPTLNQCIEHYLETCWAEFCFATRDIERYQLIRKCIEIYMKRFHQSSLVRIPWIGHYYCRWMAYNYAEERDIISYELSCLMNENEKQDENEKQRALIHECNGFGTQAQMENAFLLILVQDFIFHIVFRDLLSKDTKEDNCKNGFLYPIRFRQYENGNFTIYDLKESELFFSYGPRTCVGRSLFLDIIRPLFQDMSPWLSYSYYFVNQKKIPTNIPTVPILQTYEFSIPTAYVKTLISSSSSTSTSFKKIPMYDVVAMYADPTLMYFIVEQARKRYLDKNIEIIVAPEARAFPLAGALSHTLHLPLVCIRKKGKFPRETPTFSIEYQKGYTTVPDALEIVEQDMKGKRVLLVDDGIASGGSAKACIHLVKKCHGNVVELFVMLQHTYCKCEELDAPIHALWTIE